MSRQERLSRAIQLRARGEVEQARELLLELSAEYPSDAEVAYQTAWAHDKLGLETEAVPFYERALAGDGLSGVDRRGAFLGLGSTYRVLGRYEEAVRVLDRGVAEFPDDAGLQTFLAMALYNTGRSRESVSLLLKLLATTSDAETIRLYRRAISFYADDLDATQ